MPPGQLQRRANPMSCSTTSHRSREIFKALFFGIAPSRIYERERHYDCSYWAHMMANLALAWRWLRHRETADDVEFAREST
jgi:hypothetical protein